MSELAIRYTEDRYTSKAEVSKHISGSMIDPVWKSILEYRKPYIKTYKIDQINEYCLTVNLCLRILKMRQSFLLLPKETTLDFKRFIPHFEKRNEILWMFYHWNLGENNLSSMIHETFVLLTIAKEGQWKDFLMDPDILLEVKWVTLFNQDLSTEAAICLFVATCFYYNMREAIVLVNDVFLQTTTDFDKTYILQNWIDVLEMKILNKLNDIQTDTNLNFHELSYRYPQLKKYQIEFYLKHNTRGYFYTLEQFIDFTEVCYETSRTSMDQLVSLGFYDKIKQGKKFIYTIR